MAEHRKKDRFVGIGGDVPAKKKKDKSGLAKDIKRNVNARQTRLDEIMKSINLSTKPDKKKR